MARARRSRGRGPRSASAAAAVAIALGLLSPAAVAQPVVPPRLAAPLAPEYPEGEARATTVVVRVTVAADGSVTDARVVEGAAEARADETRGAGWQRFEANALAAVKAARFTPARRGDQAVAAVVLVAVDFVAPSTTEPEAPAPAAPAPASGPTGPTGPTGSAAPSPRAVAPPPGAGFEEVKVAGERARARAPGVVTMGRAEIRVLPGAFGDPFRVIESFSGVTPIVSGVPYFYVRGAPPGDVGYYLDGVRVPYLFHFALGPAVVHPSLIEEVQLHKGPYPASYGRYAGAIVAATTTPPLDRFHGDANIRLVDAGAIAEAPFAGGRGSALVGGRYSYTAAILSLLAPEVSIDYRDYALRTSYKLGKRDTLTLFGFGAVDIAAEIEDGKKNVAFASEFHRADLRWDHVGDGGSSTRVAATLGLDRTRFTERRFARDLLLGTRLVHVRPLSREVVLRAGADATFDVYDADAPDRYADTDEAYEQSRPIYAARLDKALGVHADVVWKPSRLVELVPGVRVDLFGSGAKHALAVDPRVSSRFFVSDRVRLINGVGLAHQPPAFPIPVPGLTIARLAGGLQQSVQTSSAIEVDTPLDVTTSAGVFHNAYYAMNDTLGNPTVGRPEFGEGTLIEKSRGSAYGLELEARRRLTRRVGGLVAYTLSRSQRTTPTNGGAPANFDRTHVLNVALSVDLGRGWRIGGRTLVYSGVPTRALGQVVRTPTFYRVDARFEKRWTIGKTGYVALVLEGLNVTLTKEVLSYSCEAGARSVSECKPEAFGPVAIPAFGVEGGF